MCLKTDAALRIDPSSDDRNGEAAGGDPQEVRQTQGSGILSLAFRHDRGSHSGRRPIQKTAVLTLRLGFLSGKITIDGSATVLPLTQAMADAFRVLDPTVQFAIQLSGTDRPFDVSQMA
jgi:ABC-type phosphate transport system substrate-binding protein